MANTLPNLKERARGLAHTGVTNELVRAVNRLAPPIRNGQVETPPPWVALPPGGARYQVLQKIDDNGTVGWDWPRIHDGTVGPPVPPDSSSSSTSTSGS